MNKPSTPLRRVSPAALSSRRAALGAVAVLAGAAAFRVVPSLAAESGW